MNRPGDAAAFLPSDDVIYPSARDIREIPEQGVIVLSLPLTLHAGESRIVTARLGVTMFNEDGSNDGAEVDDQIRCLDSALNQVRVAHYQGTNHRGPSYGELDLYASLLFTVPQDAPQTDQYTCQLLTETSDGSRTNYSITAKAGSTYLAAGSVAEVGQNWWQNNTCNPDGTDSNCVYLDSGHKTRNIFLDDSGVQNPVWTAPTNALDLEVIADVQVTSCPDGTSSCPSVHQGGWGVKSSTFFADLEFDQLDPAGNVCRIFGTPRTEYAVTNDVHHYPMRFALGDVPISANCGGSRQFRLALSVQWFDGNPLKIDGSNGYRSTTHTSVIVSRFDATTTVPNVVGLGQSAATNAIQAAGLAAGQVNRVPNAAPAGTVIGQNAPGNTVEPVNSPVDLTVSAGPVPNVLGLSQSAATSAINAAALTLGTVSYVSNCFSAGTVQGQNPAAGTVLAPNSAVNITVASCVVPNVLSLSQSDATNVIVAAGLTLGTVSTTNNCVSPGSVQVQNPQAGAVVSPGSAVNITVSTCTSGGGGGIEK